jgi:hypothetical protein
MYDMQPALRTRSSKHDKCVREKRQNKYAENAFWKRAKSIALHKQSRVENQFEESDAIIDEKWMNWVPACKLGNGWETVTEHRTDTIFYINDYDGIPFDYEIDYFA